MKCFINFIYYLNFLLKKYKIDDSEEPAKLTKLEFIEFLTNHGVQTAIHYPIPDHKQPININKFSNISLHATEDLIQNIVTLPLYPGMGEEKVDYTIQTIRKFFRHK